MGLHLFFSHAIIVLLHYVLRDCAPNWLRKLRTMFTSYKQTSVNSNLQGRVIESKLNPKRIGMIQEMLAQKYNHPEESALREYVSNGYDSHVLAGVSVPVEVTLPTEFSPNLVIQDYGLGMSSQEVVDTYSGFLFSTKNLTDDEGTDLNPNSPEEIGGFGIGSKSGLAVADQFTVAAIKDGLKSIFIATRDSGNVTFNFATENRPTTEPNGVKVTIPISNPNAYSMETVNRVLTLFKKSEVVVLNQDTLSDGLNMWNDNRVADTWTEYEHGYFNSAIFDEYGKSAQTQRMAGYIYGKKKFVSVGPVAYHAPNSFQESYDSYRFWVIPKLSVKKVEVGYSREVLKESVELNEYIQSQIDKTIVEIKNDVLAKEKNIKTIQDALVYNTWEQEELRKELNLGPIIVDGEPVPTRLNVGSGMNVSYYVGNSSSGYHVNTSMRREQWLRNDNSAKVILFDIDADLSYVNFNPYRKYFQAILRAHKNDSDRNFPDNIKPILPKRENSRFPDFAVVKDLGTLSKYLSDENIVKMTDIIEYGKELIAAERVARKALKKTDDETPVIKRGFEERNVLVLHNGFFKSVINSQMKIMVADKKVLFVHDLVTHAGGIETLSRYGTNNSISVVVIPRHIKVTQPYLDYVEGSTLLSETEIFSMMLKNTIVENRSKYGTATEKALTYIGLNFAITDLNTSSMKYFDGLKPEVQGFLKEFTDFKKALYFYRPEKALNLDYFAMFSLLNYSSVRVTSETAEYFVELYNTEITRLLENSKLSVEEQEKDADNFVKGFLKSYKK